jgi:hypothetical protein
VTRPQRYAREVADSDAFKRTLKRYFDASSDLSASLSKMTRSDLEHTLRSLTRSDSEARQRVDDVVEELRARSRRGAETLFEVLRSEAQREFDLIVHRRRDDLADLADRVTRFAGAMGRYISASATPDAASAPPPAEDAPPPAPPRRTTARGRSAGDGKGAAAPAAPRPARRTGADSTPRAPAAGSTARAPRAAKATSAGTPRPRKPRPTP